MSAAVGELVRLPDGRRGRVSRVTAAAVRVLVGTQVVWVGRERVARVASTGGLVKRRSCG